VDERARVAVVRHVRPEPRRELVHRGYLGDLGRRVLRVPPLDLPLQVPAARPKGPEPDGVDVDRVERDERVEDRVPDRARPTAVGIVGRSGSVRWRPRTKSIVKNSVPSTLASSQKARALGAGTAVPSSAEKSANSRSTACADSSSAPGGFFRRTRRFGAPLPSSHSSA